MAPFKSPVRFNDKDINTWFRGGVVSDDDFPAGKGVKKKLTKIGLPRHKCCDWMQHPDNNVKHNGRVWMKGGNMPPGFWNMMQITLISFKKSQMPMESTQSWAFYRNKHLDPVFGTSPSVRTAISFWTTSAKSLWARSWQFVQPFFWLAMIRL